MLPGVHRVRARLAGGRVAEYWYAFRGGPRILQAVAKSDAALTREVSRLTADASRAYQDIIKPRASDKFLSGLIVKYLESQNYKRLAPRTQTDLRKALDVARADLGQLEVQALQAAGALKVLLEWRDTFSATPRTADARLSALGQVMAWAKKNGDLERNVLEKAPRLYRVDRSEMIWTKTDLIKLLQGADADFRRAVLVACFTGLRLGDLVRLKWTDVGEKAITLTTAKSRGKRVVVIPISPQLRAVLKQIGRKDVGAVLVHSRGKPWTAWGLQTAMQRAKVARGIKGLRFHDLRGTAATHFVGFLPLADVATIMGWAPTRVENIAKRYVTSEAIAAGMLERLSRNKSGGRL